ncbi:phage tail tape measure protein [Alkalihalobacillus macyae]|uniref:phage tail tape measure protein n=1 Tax=Guptibacillus hwajinpoensis TaxID=208199 RepID=UPI00273B431F|nr:phage tail tape measure protein [Alkalihalobacillus macyae]MDP4549857.1 phage tail tape measure protein [Alkalihalobacillus macyae]
MAEYNGGTIRARLELDRRGFSRGFADARREASGISRISRNLSMGMQGVATTAGLAVTGAVAGVGAAVAAGAVASTKLAADFEHAMKSVEAKSGASSQEMEKLTNLAKEMGETTQFSATQSAEALDFLAMAGLDASQMLEGLPPMLSLAAAGNLDLATAADIATNIMSGFGMKANDLGHISDVLATAATSSNTSVTEMGEAMKYAAPVAASMGLSVEETAAAIGKMADAGIKGSQAGTTLRGGLSMLIKPSKKAAEMMKDLGISVKDADGNMKPMPELIGHLNDGMKDMTGTQKAATMAQLVGKEAMSGFLALLKLGGDPLENYTNKLEKSDGAAKKMADTMNDSSKGALKELQSAIEGLGIRIGEKLNPAFKDAVKNTTEFVGGISDLLKSKQELRKEAVDTGVAMLEEADNTSELITKYGHLRESSGLTADEIGELIDIIKGLKDAQNDSEIELLNARLDHLKEKTGLSNDELNEMVELNDILVEKLPGATEKISDQGNAVADAAGELAKLNAQQREAAKRDLEIQLVEGKAEYLNNLKEQEAIQSRINELESKIPGYKDDYYKKQGEYNQLQIDLDNALQEGDEAEYSRLQDLLAAKGREVKFAEDAWLKNEKNLETEQKKVDKVNEQIGKYDEILNKMASVELSQVGITAKKGEEVTAINEVIAGTQKQIDAIEEIRDKNGKLTAEERVQLDTLNEKLSKQQGVRDAVMGIFDAEKLSTEQATLLNETLAKSINKNFEIDDRTEYANSINMTLAEYIFKNFDIEDQNSYTDMINDELMREVFKAFGIENQQDYVLFINRALEQGIFKDFDLTDKRPLAGEINDMLERKVFKLFDVEDQTGYANGIHNNLQRPAYKSLTVTENINRKLHTIYSEAGLTRHNGGTLPRYHGGGSPAFNNPPNANEIDARLLRNEMVLTESQQAQLFKILDANSPESQLKQANESNGEVVQLLGLIHKAIQNGKQINIDGRNVTEAIIPRIKEMNARDQLINDRGNGRR